MSTYYINASLYKANPAFTPSYPYDKDHGFKNIKHIIDVVGINDNDKIYMYQDVGGIYGYSIEEPTFVTISANNVTIQNKYPAGSSVSQYPIAYYNYGMMVAGDKFSVSGVAFNQYAYGTTSGSLGLILTNVAGASITKCSFNRQLPDTSATYYATMNEVQGSTDVVFDSCDFSGTAPLMLVENTDRFSVINSNFMMYPTVQQNNEGVVILNGVDQCTFSRNLLSFANGYLSAIAARNFNLLYLWGIKNSTIDNNAFNFVNGKAISTSSLLHSDVVNTMIRNNVFTSDLTTSGTSIAINNTHAEASLTCLNNAFLGSTSAVSIAYAGSYNTASNILIDYNNTWNIPTSVELVTSGSLSNIGSHSIRVNPDMPIQTGSTRSDIDNFKSNLSSQMRNSGIKYLNLGIDQQNVFMYVDTALIGKDQYTNYQHFDSYIGYKGIGVKNCAYNYIGEGLYNNVPTSAIYSNQINWNINIDSSIPFTEGNEFVGKDNQYIISNRKKLQPLPNMSCPANPGAEFDSYGPSGSVARYNYGLFDSNRAAYVNGCGPIISGLCILQDTVNSPNVYVCTPDAALLLQNNINPPCASQ